MISFEPSEEQQMMRELVGTFARDEIRPAARPSDESGEIPGDLVAKASQLGLARGWLPLELGGDGNQRSALTGAMIAEELAWGDLAIAIHSMAPRLAAFPILEMGTVEQRARYLKPFSAGGFVAASAAIAEPRYDFDLLSIATKARRDGAGYLIGGDKCLVPLARESEHILVYATDDQHAGLPGVAGFIVARDTAGLEISEREQNMGLKGLATYEVGLRDCRVDEENRLGGEGGIRFARLAAEGRVAMVAMATGVARAAFEYARDYARGRKAFGSPIATKQAIAFMLADMAIEIDAMRLLGWEAASHLDRGEDAFAESCLARQYAAAAALKVADNAVQILGGHGYIREHPVEMWLRNARGFAVMEGLAIV